MATRLVLARRSRCRRTCCEMSPFAGLWDKLAVGESACAGLTGGFAVVVGSIVAGKGAAGKGVAEKVVGVGVRASGGDSSPARGRQECHSRRRTNNRCLQGRQRDGKSNSSFMQVAEAENRCARMCGGNERCAR